MAINLSLLFIKALGATILIETAVLLLLNRFARRLLPEMLPLAALLFAAILSSFATLPYLWFVLPELLPNRILLIWFGEAIVVLIEALIYWKLLQVSFFRAFIISVSCNTVSAISGLYIF
jgi:hypothetical protein